MFFSGELGYSYMLTHVPDIKVPCTLISYEDKHILSILLNFVVRYPHIPLTRVYIDFLTLSTIYEPEAVSGPQPHALPV